MNSKKYNYLRETLRKAYSSTPTLTQAQIIQETSCGFTLIAAQKRTECPKNGHPTKRNIIYELKNDKIVETQQISLESEDVVASRYSDDGKQKALLRKHKDFSLEKKKTLYVLEIWRKGVLAHHVNLFSEEEIPFLGVLCNNPFLVTRTLAWSGNGEKVIFMAEKYRKEEKIWASEGELKDYTSKFNFKNNWGEGADQFSNLDVFVFDVKTGELGKLDLEDKEDISLSHAQFLGNKGDKLTFVGYKEGILLQGIGGAMNKSSSVYFIQNPHFKILNKEKDQRENKSILTKVSEDPIALNPIPSTKGIYLLYTFSSKFRDSHLQSTGLKLYNCETKETKVLVEDEDIKDENGNIISIPFYTIGQSSSNFKWLSEDEYLIIPSLEYSGTILNLFDFQEEERRKFRLSFDFHTDSVDVYGFDSQGNSVLLGLKNFYHASRLTILSDIEQFFCHKEVRCKYIKEECCPMKLLSPNIGEFDFDYEEEKNKKADYLIPQYDIFEKCVGFDDIKAYLWGLETWKPEKKLNERPAILVLHGGPHSIRSIPFDPAHNILLNKGFLILTVNFSGTVTHGSEINERICGKIGEKCVSEIMKVVTNLQEKDILTKEKLHYEGGSYSGYLGFVFLQKYPKMFKSMILRNPVVNLFHLKYSTDIPSWISREAFGKENKFEHDVNYSDEELLRLKELSPGMKEFSKDCETKVRVFLGLGDNRVPHRGMVFLLKKLKEIGIDCLVFNFEKSGHNFVKLDDIFEIKLRQLVECGEDFEFDDE